MRTENFIRIFDIISGYIQDNDVCFVFPSEVTAALWARKICTAGGDPRRPGSGVRSVAANRFMAWDRFKESVIRIERRDKKPVSALLRKAFVRSLVRDNLSDPFLQVIIPPDYADNGEAFVRFITSVLPALESWEKTLGGSYRDGEDRDLFAIKTRYTSFLEHFSLFEPSWEKPPFNGGGKRYVVFFPETLEDFSEYREILSCPQVTFVEPDTAAETSGETAEDFPGLRFFASAREEIREAVIAIRNLHDKKGIPYSDMAVSLPDFERVAPYLLRELSLCDVPCVLRAGKCLSDYGAGRLFSLIRECAGSSFSFDAVKALVLNAFIPWKDPGLNGDLINFGIYNHCVSPFSEKGRGTVDVWEEALKNSGGVELKNYYELLKRRVSDVAESKTFAQIRDRYFGFRELLDMEKCSAENNAVLARCIEELSILIELEEEYPGALPAPADRPEDGLADPYGFYISHLEEKKYVPVRESGGINIYEYPVAAGAPFACSFVLNAGQNAVTLQYRPLKFLRQDKRIRLGLEDRDVSAAFVALFRSGQIFVPNGTTDLCPDGQRSVRETAERSFLWFSASEKSFSGWDKPHSCFIRGSPGVTPLSSGVTPDPPDAAPVPSGVADETAFRPVSPCGQDRFLAEKAWWLDAFQNPAGFDEDKTFPESLFSVQKKGFTNWSTVLLESGNGFNYLREKAAGETAELLRKRIGERKAVKENVPENSGVLSVSATDLTEFFSCPVFWLYKRVFDLEEYPIDAAMLDDVSLGNIHHKILQRLFEKIKKEDGSFRAARLEQYCRWAGEVSSFIFRNERDFKGLLAYPLLEPLAAAMTRRVCSLLRTEAKYFSGFAVDALEEKLSFVKGLIRFTGTIDRVSLYPAAKVLNQDDVQNQGGALIVDYKTGKSPSQNDCVLSGGVLKNFQMPMYILLYEEKTRQKVAGAYFFSINKNEIKQIVGTLPRKKGVSREKYQETLDSVDRYSDRFRSALEALDFSPDPVPFLKCVSCPYKSVCRSAYALNPALRKTRDYCLAEDEIDRVEEIDGLEEKGDAAFS